MYKIPLHSLVLDFSNTTKNHVNEYEFVSYDQAELELFGINKGYFGYFDVLDYIKFKIKQKLSVGERVVVDAKNLKKYEREQIINIASKYDINIFYIINQSYNNITDKEILRGDNKAQVFIIKNLSNLSFVNKINEYNKNIVFQNFNGITVVGDVHGQLESMISVIDWAKSRNNFIVFLGDIIDFGPNSLECIKKVYEIIIRNKGLMILGNHEKKIFKWLNKLNNNFIKLYISESNQKTIEKIKSLTPIERKKWEIKFKTIINLSKTHFLFRDLFFVHAAFDINMLNYSNQNFLPMNLEKTALFGYLIENNNKESNTVPKLDYSWTNNLPNDLQVFVGHEIRSIIKPLIITNQNNSKIYFMDTGSGKGGKLTSADIKFLNDKKSIVQNFNSW